MHGNGYGCFCILLHVDIHLCQHHLLNMLSFFHFIFLASLSKNRCSEMHGMIFRSLVLLPVFMPIPGCFHYCSSIVDFEGKDYDVSKCLLIVQDCFDYPRFFFSYEVEYCSFEVCEEFCWDFDGDYLESIDCFK